MVVECSSVSCFSRHVPSFANLLGFVWLSQLSFVCSYLTSTSTGYCLERMWTDGVRSNNSHEGPPTLSLKLRQLIESAKAIRILFILPMHYY